MERKKKKTMHMRTGEHEGGGNERKRTCDEIIVNEGDIPIAIDIRENRSNHITAVSSIRAHEF